MGKQKANQKVFQSRDVFHRLNFLYQASRMMATQFPDKPGVSTCFASLMTNVAKKSTLRLEPTVKRTLCKGCSNILLPGLSARVRLHKKGKQWLVWTCLQCGTVKKFFTRRGHKLWCETSEALVNVISSSNVPKLNTSQDRWECKVEKCSTMPPTNVETVASVERKECGVENDSPMILEHAKTAAVVEKLSTS